MWLSLDKVKLPLRKIVIMRWTLWKDQKPSVHISLVACSVQIMKQYNKIKKKTMLSSGSSWWKLTPLALLLRRSVFKLRLTGKATECCYIPLLCTSCQTNPIRIEAVRQCCCALIFFFLHLQKIVFLGWQVITCATEMAHRCDEARKGT